MRREGLLFASGLVCAVSLLTSRLSSASRAVEVANIKLLTREVSLGRIRPTIRGWSFIVSPDNKRVAYMAGGNTQFVVVDGVEGKVYENMGTGTPVFSPDSKRVAYEAKRGGKHLVVVDGMEGKEYYGIADVTLGEGRILFSPDSKRLAYWAELAEKWCVVVDGAEGKEYDERWETTGEGGRTPGWALSSSARTASVWLTWRCVATKHWRWWMAWKGKSSTRLGRR
jgi:hypothetical protein